MIIYSIYDVDMHCCDRFASSVACPAAVDGEDGTGDVSGLWVSEQQCCSGEFFRGCPAAHRDLGVEEAPDVRVVIDPVVERRAERPGSERVHRDAGSGELSSEAACELDDSALAGGVPGAARAADEPECAGKSEDAAVPGLAHRPGGRAAGEPGSHYVDL